MLVKGHLGVGGTVELLRDTSGDFIWEHDITVIGEFFVRARGDEIALYYSELKTDTNIFFQSRDKVRFGHGSPQEKFDGAGNVLS